MFCQNCGTYNNDSDKFCCECGAKINSNSSNQQNTGMNCINNGNINPGINCQNQNKGYANIAMVLAILSIIICCAWPFFGLPAMIFGIISLNKNEPETGKAWFGIIVGIIGLIITVIGLAQR
ncbi:MAG: hypothetical protein ACI4JB_04455 [Porcipelethomonas sp.]